MKGFKLSNGYSKVSLVFLKVISVIGFPCSLMQCSLYRIAGILNVGRKKNSLNPREADVLVTEVTAKFFGSST